jgi:uncharacterized protein (TIGR00251 family)
MYIKVSVIPNAKNASIIKIDATSYKAKVNAVAVNGKANNRLIEMFAEYFKINKSKLKIIKGFNNRNKLISVENL